MHTLISLTGLRTIVVKLVFILFATACTQAATPRPTRLAARPTVCAGTVVSSQAQLVSLRGCVIIKGDLFIRGPDPKALQPLYNLRVVAGHLSIEKTNLRTLSGLSSLRRTERLSLLDNVNLKDVTALDGLVSLGSLHIENSPSLRETRGFSGLRSLDVLAIENTALSSLGGLSNLKAVERVTIKNNQRLISVRGLNGLVNARSIELVHNPRVYAEPYAFFSQLQRVNQLTVEGNFTIPQTELDALRTRIERVPPPSVVSGVSRRD